MPVKAAALFAGASLQAPNSGSRSSGNPYADWPQAWPGVSGRRFLVARESTARQPSQTRNSERIMFTSPNLTQAKRTAAVVAADPFERHYSPLELAKIWGLDASTIRRIFRDESGVLKHGKQDRRDGKRDHVTLRIPESVARRVYGERTRRQPCRC